MSEFIDKNKNTGLNPGVDNRNRSAKAFRSRKEETRYWILLITLFVYGLLVYNNPVPMGSPSFVPIVKRRLTAIVAMIIAAVCQSLATVAFQSSTNNRILTPSLLGFEALYSTIHTVLFWCRCIYKIQRDWTVSVSGSDYGTHVLNPLWLAAIRKVWQFAAYAFGGNYYWNRA